MSPPTLAVVLTPPCLTHCLDRRVVYFFLKGKLKEKMFWLVLNWYRVLLCRPGWTQRQKDLCVSPERWDWRCVPPHLAKSVNFTRLTSCVRMNEHMYVHGPRVPEEPQIAWSGVTGGCKLWRSSCVCVWEWRLSSSSCGALRKPHLQGVDFIAPSIELVGFGANFRLTTLVVLLSWKHF